MLRCYAVWSIRHRELIYKYIKTPWSQLFPGRSNQARRVFAMSGRPPLTCHVLDTTTGRPAADIVCSVYKVDLVEDTAEDGSETCREAAPSEPFAMARTDCDGRVPQWTFDPSPAKRQQLAEMGILQDSSSGQMHWDKIKYGTYRMRFQVGKYYRALGQENFHPVVDIMFKVADSKHYHIPLLLSNYGYTTYRGS